MSPTGVWARTSAIGVPVQPAAVSWPFQVGLSGIQISGSSALGSLRSATTSLTDPVLTWMSMHGSSALTSLTACFTRSSITGAVVRVTSSETQSAASVALSLRMAKKPMRPTTSSRASPANSQMFGMRRPAPPAVSAASGAVESLRLMRVLPQRCQSGVWARLICSLTVRGRTRK